MASAASGTSHLGVTDNQKRWLVAGIALNKILVPQIRPFVEQEVDKEYNNLKTSHNIHAQSTSARLQRWSRSPRKFLKYENINRNDVHPKLPGGRYNYSLFDCRVLTHIAFAKLYVESYMAKFNAFDDHCDASALLSLLGGVPVFSVAVQAAEGDVRIARNDWAHCVFRKWDQAKFQQSFAEMEHLVRVMALPAADEGKILGELKDWENKGTLLCMNSPVDPALLQLVDQEIKSLQGDVNLMSVEFKKEKARVQQELQNIATLLQKMKLSVQKLEDRVDDFQEDVNQRVGQVEDKVQDLQEGVNQRVERVEEKVQDLQEDVNQRVEQVEDKVQDLQVKVNQRVEQVEDKVQDLQGKFEDLTLKEKGSMLATTHQDNRNAAVNAEQLVELIKREYKGAVLCPFPWCEDELQLELSNIFTRLKIVSKTKERSRQTADIINMSDVFRPYGEYGKPRVVLIEGNPGMGKTTYCQKLAYDWSWGEIPPEASFPKVEMLLLLKCREMNMKTFNIEEAIDEQLLPQDADKKEKQNFFKFIRCNQSRILLVLDGLDELRQDLFQSVLPLIQGKIFSNIYLMLTARHEAGRRVRRYCDTLLEIVGYTDSDADSYIKRYFSKHDDPSLADRMIEKLQKDKQLRELTANPLNTALLCLLFEETKGEFPSKRTELYDGLVECALRRYFVKRGVSLDGDDPVERCTDQLNQLGRMAFEALLKDQLHFTENEMKCKSTDFLQLCFLSREPSVSKMRPMPCYAFTHKSFQEYFSAFYLAHQVLNSDKQSGQALLAQLNPDCNWLVWEILFTMVTSKSVDKGVFVVSCLCTFFLDERPVSNRTKVDSTVDSYFDVHICEGTSFVCPFEYSRSLSEDEKELNTVLMKALHLVAECEHGENELKDYQRKMVHVLAHRFPLRKLELTPNSRYWKVYSEYLKLNCTLTDLDLNSDFNKLLLATVKDGFHSENKLMRFSLRNCDKDNHFVRLLLTQYWPSACLDLVQRFLLTSHIAFIVLGKILQSCRFLTHLYLSNIWIGNVGVKALADLLNSNSALTHLRLECTMIGDQGAVVFKSALQSNCTLKHLSLPDNWIGGLGVGALAKRLHANDAPEYLDPCVAVLLAQEYFMALNATERNVPFRRSDGARVKQIGPSEASALARGLEVNCSLTSFELQHNAIGDAGAAAIAKALQFNCTLTQLNVKDNEVGNSGAQALGRALKLNSTLTHLNIEDNNISDLGAVAIAKALRSSGIQLTCLHLGSNYIRCLGATAFAEALLFNCSLTHLRLRDNEIETSGAYAFAEALQSNRTLKHLDLRLNIINDSEASALVQAVQCHNDILIRI